MRKINGLDNNNTNPSQKHMSLKDMLDTLTTAHTNFATRPVFFVSDTRRLVVNTISLSVYGDEYTLLFDGDTKSFGSSDMVNMMKKVYELYGDRPVKVMMDAVTWNVVDLRFQTSGRDYCFVLEQVK